MTDRLRGWTPQNVTKTANIDFQTAYYVIFSGILKAKNGQFSKQAYQNVSEKLESKTLKQI